LEHCGRGYSCRTHHQGRASLGCIAAANGQAEKQSSQGPGSGKQGQFLLLFDAACHVALGNVREFVRNDSCQFRLCPNFLDQAGKDVDIPARDGKGVQNRVGDDRTLDPKGHGAFALNDSVDHFGDIVGDICVSDHGHLTADYQVEVPPHLILLADGELVAWKYSAEGNVNRSEYQHKGRHDGR